MLRLGLSPWDSPTVTSISSDAELGTSCENLIFKRNCIAGGPDLNTREQWTLVTIHRDIEGDAMADAIHYKRDCGHFFVELHRDAVTLFRGRSIWSAPVSKARVEPPIKTVKEPTTAVIVGTICTEYGTLCISNHYSAESPVAYSHLVA